MIFWYFTIIFRITTNSVNPDQTAPGGRLIRIYSVLPDMSVAIFTLMGVTDIGRMFTIYDTCSAIFLFSINAIIYFSRQCYSHSCQMYSSGYSIGRKYKIKLLQNTSNVLLDFISCNSCCNCENKIRIRSLRANGPCKHLWINISESSCIAY